MQIRSNGYEISGFIQPLTGGEVSLILLENFGEDYGDEPEEGRFILSLYFENVNKAIYYILKVNIDAGFIKETDILVSEVNSLQDILTLTNPIEWLGGLTGGSTPLEVLFGQCIGHETGWGERFWISS